MIVVSIVKKGEVESGHAFFSYQHYMLNVKRWKSGLEMSMSEFENWQTKNNLNDYWVRIDFIKS